MTKLWFSIWFSPRKTIDTIMKTDQIPILLIIVKGLVFNLNFSAVQSFGKEYSLVSILGWSLFFAVVSGPILVGVWSYLLTWIGKWFGGIGDVRDVKKVYVWTAVFDSVNLFVYSILIMCMGNGFFDMNAGEYATFFEFCISLLGTVAYFWSIVYLILALSEIHAFSKWKSFFTIACVIGPLALLGLS